MTDLTTWRSWTTIDEELDMSSTNGISLSFADGTKGLIPYEDVPELKVRAAVSSLDLPNPYEMILRTVQGEQIQIPWDFARHYCDASYRPTIELMALRGRQTVGERIRHLRESKGLTQEALARSAAIGRVTLIRLKRESRRPDSEHLRQLLRPWGDVSRNFLSNRSGLSNSRRQLTAVPFRQSVD